MNAVEIEQAISELADQPYDAAEFPFAFLECFDNSDARSKKLRKGTSNKSDIDGVLQVGNIHIKTCDVGLVPETLTALKDSKATQTKRNKVRFVLVTDGEHFEAEDLVSGDIVSCAYDDFPNHFVFFWPLAGLSKTKQLSESEFDVRATLRLNKLYVTLRADNPDWGTPERRHEMNHFMARLIFLFFAEDTDILAGDDLFTATVEQMANRDGSNTHEVISELFRAMNTPIKDRAATDLPRWADAFPYVNGGLFSGSTEVPRFSLIAQRYLIKIGNLNWQRINPDIFGSMIQAVADDEERSKLGMHYTSVPNILKVLNPLFLDDLKDHLDRAGDSPQKLINLRKRMSNIRVFDPACGSGNFLVIAYKQMREIEAKINERRGEADRASDISIQNFRGIELRDFSAEIARLALIIAEYQCDVLYRGPKVARDTFLPLDARNWITCGNALRLDWLDVCPPTCKAVKLTSDDLFDTPLEQAAIDFENEGGETYICGNPPYIGTKYQSKEVKEEMARVFDGEGIKFGNLDLIACWFLKASRFLQHQTKGSYAFVSTTSLFQGEQAEAVLHILKCHSQSIHWCHTSFAWSNNAANNAGVTVCIVGVGDRTSSTRRYIFDGDIKREVASIGPYLVPMKEMVVTKRTRPISDILPMSYGSMSNDGGHFDVSEMRYRELISADSKIARHIKRSVGGAEFIRGIVRKSIYIDEASQLTEKQEDLLAKVFQSVREYRSNSTRPATRKLSEQCRFFAERRHKSEIKVFVPQVLSGRRSYVTCGLLEAEALVLAPHMQIIGGGLKEFALLSSRLHQVWIETVCGRLKTDIRYSNLLGWNTFPLPFLTAKNKSDLAKAAAQILLCRERYFPIPISKLYDDSEMPEDLRKAHQENDEILERIWLGRAFNNDTERLEKLFQKYEELSRKAK